MGGWRIRAHDVAHPTDPFKRVPVSMAPSALHGDVGDRTYGFGSVTFACGAMTAASLGDLVVDKLRSHHRVAVVEMP
jgi:hypothetical protein